MSSSTNDLMYALREIPGTGMGLIATRSIPMGTRILSEEPVIKVLEGAHDTPALRVSIKEQVDALTPDQRKAFLSMHNIYGNDTSSRYLGIIRTNALPIGDRVGGGGIFLNACRINHACDNNAQKSWNDNIERHTVHARRDIEPGEEITIFYLGILNNRQARQEALRRKFAFTCSCHLCSLPLDQSQETDRKLEKILKLDELIGSGGFMGILSAPLQKLRYVDQQIQLYNEMGPNDNGLPRAYFDAAQIAIAHSDLARARIFVEKAVRGWKMLEGDDSSTVLRYQGLSQDPSKNEMYGMSKKWKTAVNDVPEGLDREEFEDWLWRREKPSQPRQLAHFRDQTTFPSFDNLPVEHQMDSHFYTISDELTYRPRRHWLFFAEIVDFDYMIRLEMSLKDVDSSKVRVFFYTEGRGNELERALIQKGHTVAILYAEFHRFAFSEPGIRLEEPQNMKIFPCSLEKLLALSDRVQRFSIETRGTRTCHGCERQAANLKKCAKCSLFWYCNSACQTTGWMEKGHKADCKLLKDNDLNGLFSLDWDNFNGHVEFPLRQTN